MNYKEILKDQAIEVEELLNIYINIHNYIFKKAATFISLFKKVDFQYLYDQTVNLLLVFDTKKIDLNNLKITFNDNISYKYQQYFNQLCLFFECLYNTVVLLKERQHQLLLKSKGNYYNFQDFMNLQNKYKSSINTYMNEGFNLNKINYIVFDEH